MPVIQYHKDDGILSKKIREILFAGFQGCSNGDCVITGKKNGIQTNDSCNCLLHLSKSQINILTSRLKMIGEKNLLQQTPARID